MVNLECVAGNGDDDNFISLPIIPWAKPSTITFTDAGIVIDCATGNVTYPDTLNMNEASKAFWQAVRDNFPLMDWK